MVVSCHTAGFSSKPIPPSSSTNAENFFENEFVPGGNKYARSVVAVGKATYGATLTGNVRNSLRADESVLETQYAPLASHQSWFADENRPEAMYS